MHTLLFLKNYLTEVTVIFQTNGLIVSIGFVSNTTCSIPASLKTSVTTASVSESGTFDPTCTGIHISFNTNAVCLYTPSGS
jgi:hypothetical protein